MCLSIPGKIVSIDESTPELRMGKVDFSGIQKDVCLQWVPEALLGDYVLVHVGFALTKIDEDEAMITLRAMTELGEALELADNDDAELQPPRTDEDNDAPALRLRSVSGEVNAPESTVAERSRSTGDAQ